MLSHLTKHVVRWTSQRFLYILSLSHSLRFSLWKRSTVCNIWCFNSLSGVWNMWL